MKEDLLRGMIRKQIKSSLKEVDYASKARGQVGSALGKIEKMAGIKMLKKALGQGSPVQQAAGLLKVVQAISGNNPLTAKQLARMLLKTSGSESTAEPTAEPMGEAIPASLAARQARVDKTSAMKMMKANLGTKPASQQADFVIDLINNLDLKDAAKQRLFLKMRKELGGKK
jgi:hypothetical protein